MNVTSQIATPSPVGRIILDRLADRNMTQAEFARSIGLSYKLLVQCVNGWRHFPRKDIDRIATALGLEGEAHDKFKLEALQYPTRVKSEPPKRRQYDWNKLSSLANCSAS